MHSLVARHMIGQRTGGAITTITSVDGFSSSRFHVAYGAANRASYRS